MEATETDNANDFYSKIDWAIVYTFLTSIDSAAEYCVYILSFQIAFLGVKVRWLCCRAGKLCTSIFKLFSKKHNNLKLLVGRVLLCSCSFSWAISRGTHTLDWPFCCYFSSLILRLLRAGLVPEKHKSLLQMNWSEMFEKLKTLQQKDEWKRLVLKSNARQEMYSSTYLLHTLASALGCFDQPGIGHGTESVRPHWNYSVAVL